MTAPLRSLTMTEGSWAIDPDGSTAAFTVGHFRHSVSGTVPIVRATAVTAPNGDLVQAFVELNLAGIATGNRRRDSDLAKPHLLNTGRHPTAVVEIGNADWSGTGWTPAATLHARGASTVLPLVATVADIEPGRTATVRITGVVDRTELGLKVPAFIIGRRVEVDVTAVFLVRAATVAPSAGP